VNAFSQSDENGKGRGGGSRSRGRTLESNQGEGRAPRGAGRDLERCWFPAAARAAVARNRGAGGADGGAEREPEHGDAVRAGRL